MLLCALLVLKVFTCESVIDLPIRNGFSNLHLVTIFAIERDPKSLNRILGTSKHYDQWDYSNFMKIYQICKV